MLLLPLSFFLFLKQKTEKHNKNGESVATLYRPIRAVIYKWLRFKYLNQVLLKLTYEMFNYPVVKTVLDLFTWSQEPLFPSLPVVYWAPRGWAIYSTLWFPCLLVCSWVWPTEGDSRSQKESKMGIFIPLVPSSWCLRGLAISPQPKVCQGSVCLKPPVCPHSENPSPPPTSWGLEIVLTQGFWDIFCGFLIPYPHFCKQLLY